MDFFRVCNWHPDASNASENGHPLFVWPDQGGGRVDDPLHEYLVLYLGSDPVGAVAEAFGRFASWRPAVLQPPPAARPGTRKALAHYVGDPEVLDLDDPAVLLDLGLRPSQVVDRDRDVTQQWARRVFDQRRTAGVSWWSYYDPQWTSYGIWDWSGLQLVGTPTPLALENAVVRAAADAIVRPVLR